MCDSPDLSELNSSKQANSFADYLQGICSDHHVGSARVIAEKDPQHQFSFFFMGLGGTLICFVGMLINLLSLLQLNSYRMRIGEKAVYIGTLVIWDCCLLSNGWVSLSLSVLIGKGQLITSGYFVRSYNYTQALMHVSLTGVVWTTVLLTIERYVTVSRPLVTRKGRAMRAVRLVIAVAIGAAGFNVPRFFEVRFKECCHMLLNQMVTEATRAEFAMPGRPYYLWYRLLGKTVLVALVPFLTLSVLTHLIIRRVKSWDAMFGGRHSTCSASQIEPDSRTSVARSNTALRLQRSLSRVLSFVLLKFLVCHSPCVVSDIAECVLFDPSNAASRGSWFFSYLIDIGNFLVLLHSATTGAFLLAFSRRGLSKKMKHIPTRYMNVSKMEENPEGECEEIC